MERIVINIPAPGRETFNRKRQQFDLVRGGEHPKTPIDIKPGIPDLVPYNRAFSGILVRMTAHAKKISDQLLNPNFIPVRLNRERGFSPAVMMDAVTEGLANNSLFAGKDGAPALALSFIENQTNKILEVIKNENSGDDISEAHRKEIRPLMRDATGKTLDIKETALADKLEGSMARKDKERVKMSDEAKTKLAIKAYTDLISKAPEGFDKLSPHEQRKHLAYAELQGFLIAMWTRNVTGSDYFYIHLAQQVEAQNKGQVDDRRKLWDPYRLGIASALCVNDFRNLANTNSLQPGARVPERKFAEMISEVGKVAFRKLVTRRVFSDIDAKTSQASVLVEAFKKYLEGTPISDPKTIKALDNARTHIAEVVLNTASDFIDYASHLPPFSLQEFIHNYGCCGKPIPQFTNQKVAERTDLLIDALVNEIDNYSKAKTKKAPKLLFDQNILD
jgi:hypothetical protein